MDHYVTIRITSGVRTTIVHRELDISKTDCVEILRYHNQILQVSIAIICRLTENVFLCVARNGHEFCIHYSHG